MISFELRFPLKMKEPFELCPIILFLLVSSELAKCSMASDGANAVRIPEHSCHKLIDESSRCELHKCIQKCSKEPSGLGVCKDNTCFCTYYCKDPPI